MADERRRHVRKRVDMTIHVQVEGASERETAHLSDLSLGGAFVEIADDPPPFGAKVTLLLGLPSGRELALTGVIRWTKRDGMGVQFGTLRAAETYHLTEFLADLEPIPDSRFIG